jgi:hypothetical protein
VDRRIGLEEERGWAPRFLDREVVQAYTSTGTEILPVLQRGGDLRVPGSTVDIVAFQPKDGPCIAQQVVMLVRVGEKAIDGSIDSRGTVLSGSILQSFRTSRLM